MSATAELESELEGESSPSLSSLSSLMSHVTLSSAAAAACTDELVLLCWEIAFVASVILKLVVHIVVLELVVPSMAAVSAGVLVGVRAWVRPLRLTVGVS